MTQFRASPGLWPVLLFALIFLAAGPARADCTSPAGVERDMLYNNNYHTFQFCDGTNWYSMKGGGGSSSGGLTLISTQTASASASLQFTSLPTSYNTLFLNCAGLQPATNSVNLELQFGEGAGPTWKTASYQWASVLNWNSNSAADGGHSSTATSLTSYIDVAGSNDVSNNSAYGVSAHLYISNVASSSVYKTVDGHISYFDTGPNSDIVALEGTYVGDTTAVTAIRLLFSSGNISTGTCSLYGMN